MLAKLVVIGAAWKAWFWHSCALSISLEQFPEGS